MFQAVGRVGLGPRWKKQELGKLGGEMGQFLSKTSSAQPSGQELGGRVTGAQGQPPPAEHLLSQTCQ